MISAVLRCYPLACAAHVVFNLPHREWLPEDLFARDFEFGFDH